MAAQNPIDSVNTVVDIALIAELACGAAANCLILAVFYRKPTLLTIANRFIINLTIINIIACFSLLPLAIADNTLSASSPYRYVICSLSEFTSHLSASLIPYSVVLIAIDQYFAVVNPLHYHSVISGVKSLWMIAAAWVIPLILSVLGVVQSETYGHRQSVFKSCALAQTDNSSSIEEVKPQEKWIPLTFSLSFVALSFVLPFFLICFIYSRICAAASGNAKRTKTDMGRMPDKGSTVSCTDSSRMTEQEEPEWDEDDSGLHMNAAPSFTVTRPSPPRTETTPPKTSRSTIDLTTKYSLVLVNQNNQLKSNISLPNLKTSRSDLETGLLKPFLPRNTSFCLPPVVTITPQRRHSNVPICRAESDGLPKIRSLSKHSSFSNSSRHSSTRIPVSRASSIRSTSSHIVSNLRYRLSNAGLFRYRDRARAARVSALVVIMSLFCWLPFFTMYLIHVGINLLIVPISHVPQIVNAGVVVLLLMSTVVSPALFAFRNRKIRKEIRKMFKLPVNELKKSYPVRLTRRSFVLSVKQQAVEFFSQLKPAVVASQKSVISTNMSSDKPIINIY